MTQKVSLSPNQNGFASCKMRCFCIIVVLGKGSRAVTKTSFRPSLTPGSATPSMPGSTKTPLSTEMVSVACFYECTYMYVFVRECACVFMHSCMHSCMYAGVYLCIRALVSGYHCDLHVCMRMHGYPFINHTHTVGVTIYIMCF